MAHLISRDHFIIVINYSESNIKTILHTIYV